MAAKPSEGVSVNRHKRMILICVRQLAPIASQARHFPPSAGEADTKEESNQVFISVGRNERRKTSVNRHGRIVSCKTTVNACLSFLNEVKNPA